MKSPAFIRRVLRAPSLKGFTLIETFVAITILLTAIVAPLSIASQGLYAARVASDQISALFLGQDAVEYVRWIKDSNRLTGNGWLATLSNCASGDGSKTCYFDSTESPSLAGNIAICGASCPVMNYDSTTHFYNYQSSNSTNLPSKFTRTVSLTTPVCASGGSPCNSDEAALSVKVSWQSGSLVHTFTLRENIFNWQ